MIEEFAGLTSYESEQAVYAFVRRASPEKIREVLRAIGGDFQYDPIRTKQRALVKYIVEGGNSEFYNSKAKDDRMDVCDFRNPFSLPWEAFLQTFAGRHIGKGTLFRENLKKTIPSIVAVVRRCHYEEFCRGEEQTLIAVIAEKFSRRKFYNNFGEQTCLARGTAFYIGNNLLLTASHNLRDEKGLIAKEDLVYIFDYAVSEAKVMPKLGDVVAYQGEVILEGDGLNDDWAVLRLGAELSGGNGKPLSSRIPLKLSANQNHPKWRQGCYSVGFSMGVPMKLSLVGHHLHKLLADRFAVNLDMFHGNSGSPVLNIQTNEVIGLFVAGFPDLVEIGDDLVGLRQYRYGDIAKNRGGEHCQLIGKILPKMAHLLAHSDFSTEAQVLQTHKVVENTNFPYSYIHKGSSSTYRINILIDSSPSYTINNDLNSDLSQLHRQISFRKNGGTETPSTLPYKIEYNKAGTIVMVLTEEYGDIRKTELDLDSASDIEADMEKSVLYLPHTYLVYYISDKTLEYQLFVKIPANQKGFSVTISADKSSFVFREDPKYDFIGKYWPYASCRFTTTSGTDRIIIETYDQHNNPRGKGTIRHSAADNKPFDLLTCD